MTAHGFCRDCGWRKGGHDSWDGHACRCGHSDPPIPPAQTQAARRHACIMPGCSVVVPHGVTRCDPCRGADEAPRMSTIAHVMEQVRAGTFETKGRLEATVAKAIKAIMDEDKKGGAE